MGRDLAWCPSLQSGQWLEFEDANGRGMAQPDFWATSEGHILLVEAKLSLVDASAQVLGLYRPLLESLTGLPVRCLVVVKWLRPGLEPAALLPWNHGKPRGARRDVGCGFRRGNDESARISENRHAAQGLPRPHGRLPGVLL